MINNRTRNKYTPKAKPPYWRIVQYFKRLQLKYYEHNIGEPNFFITINDFGLVFKFSSRYPLPSSYSEGWDVINVDLEEYEKNPIPFGNDLMLLLISKGYMAYIRGPSGSGKLFRRLLIDEGWANKVIDKRLELYKDEPRHRFLINLNKDLRARSDHYIITYYPSFFDYLW